MSTDARFELHQSLESVLGPVPAATLMAHLPPEGWGDVARQHDVEQLGLQLRTELVAMKHELTATFRAELLSAVTAQTRTIVFANLSLVLASVGLAFAAAELAG